MRKIRVKIRWDLFLLAVLASCASIPILETLPRNSSSKPLKPEFISGPLSNGVNLGILKNELTRGEGFKTNFRALMNTPAYQDFRRRKKLKKKVEN